MSDATKATVEAARAAKAAAEARAAAATNAARAAAAAAAVRATAAADAAWAANAAANVARIMDAAASAARRAVPRSETVLKDAPRPRGEGTGASGGAVHSAAGTAGAGRDTGAAIGGGRTVEAATGGSRSAKAAGASAGTARIAEAEAGASRTAAGATSGTGRGVDATAEAGKGTGRGIEAGRATQAEGTASPTAEAGKGASGATPGSAFKPRAPWQFATAAKTKTNLEQVADGLGGSLVQIGTFPVEQVQGIAAADGKILQVWVNPGYGRYRAAYKAAMNLPNQLKPLGNLDHVDHVMPRARALASGYGYELVVPVRGRINVGWGGTERELKKLLAHPRGPDAEPPIRGVNEMQLAKVLEVGKKDPRYLGDLDRTNPSGGLGIYGDPDRPETLKRLEEWGLVRPGEAGLH